MSFIGVIANRKCFENIKKKIKEEIKDETMNFILINLRSIENIKNVKFETIIVDDDLSKFKNYQEILNKVFEKVHYLLLNTDRNEEMPNAISYGLNQKASVTVSSISDTGLLVYWQKVLKDRNGNTTEIEERRIQKEKGESLKVYETLVIYTLLKLYHQNIMEEI